MYHQYWSSSIQLENVANIARLLFGHDCVLQYIQCQLLKLCYWINIMATVCLWASQ